MGTPRRQKSKMEWKANRPVTKYDSSKIAAAPYHEPLKMKPYVPEPNPRQDEIDAYRKIRSLHK